ncbi:hypothetical protein niasHS_008245 [Heterodera schachtii]|uniref:DUF3817 domain-containing protein n=1 Tax=Heterodera schachtii TaxID=97005 RepID=A0ABD2IY01_HETSC
MGKGAASTIVGISVLYTVDAYIILTFFKTIWLTMVMGLVHGLVFIPVLLSFLPMAFFQIRHKKPQKHNEQQQKVVAKTNSLAANGTKR